MRRSSETSGDRQGHMCAAVDAGVLI
jgi:hypothetical protein